MTPSEFKQGCKEFILKCGPAHDDLFRRIYSYGWQWHEYSAFPQLSYMSRTLRLPAGSLQTSDLEDDALEIEETTDDAASTPSDSVLVTVHLSVVYSPTYQVPALYFTAHYTNGSPLTLPEIVRLPLFRPGLFPGSSESNSYAVNVPESTFAMLSQGDHPTLGTPSWYFHPCHTSDMVNEIVGEESKGILRWIESWFLVLSNVIDFSPRESTVL